MSELLFTSATDLGRMLQQKQVSSAELTQLFLNETKRLNPSLSAFTYIAEKRARLAARKWDAQKKTRSQGPLSGVPTAMKDLQLVRMMPVGFGSNGIPIKLSPVDDDITKQVRQAGMIILGKLATSELGAMPVTSPDTHSPTRCPFNTEFTAGGSSGGTGAAVAAGMIPIGQGGDGGGSIRIPAAINHLVGLKASRGILVNKRAMDAQLRMVAMGALAHTVEDLAAFQDLLTVWPHHYHEHFATKPRANLRIAVVTNNPLSEVPQAYKEAAEKTAKILEKAGAALTTKIWPDVDIEEFLILWKRLLANVPLAQNKRLQPVTRWLREEGKKIPVAKATRTRIAIEQLIHQWKADVDLVISPTLAMQPVKADFPQQRTPKETFMSIAGMGAFTAAFNVSGHPAISIPMGIDGDGVPIGVQIAGQWGTDLELMQIAHLIENEVGGFIRKPNQ